MEIQSLFRSRRREREKLRAKCTLCAPSKKPLSTAQNTTSYFKKHLQTVHKTTKLVEKDPSKGQGETSKKRERDSEDVGEPSQQKRQCTLAKKLHQQKSIVEYQNM